jgi:hypothetical protein
MKVDQHLALAKKVSALGLGKLSREDALEQLAPILADLDAVDAFAVLLFARVATEPRKVDDGTVAHIKAAMSAIRFRSHVA